jgi:amino acid adenylation domain-containing protein
MSLTVPLKPVLRNQILPLSFDQYRLWFLYQLEPNSVQFNINKAFRIRGPLHRELFERSLNKIIARHESMRTVFKFRGDEPEQMVLEKLEIEMPRVDLRMLPVEQREAYAIKAMNAEMLNPFLLETGPLLSAHLFQLDDQDQIFLFRIHHIIADFDSLGRIIKELMFFYTSFVKNEPGDLPELPLQYADYSYWQRNRLQGALYAKQMSYWRDILGGELPVLRMPLDRPRPGVLTHNGARTHVSISRELTNALHEFSRKNGVTLFMTLLAAYQTLLYRYTGQKDICTGTSITSRSRPELWGLIGLFANTLVLRSNLSENPTFLELLKRTRKMALGAFTHQDIPFEKLMEELQPERNVGHNLFFQTMFLYLKETAEDISMLPELMVKPFEFEKKATTLELNFTVTEQESGLLGTMDYNTDLYDHETINRFLVHYKNLLQAIINNPEQTILELQFMPETERQQILNEWSGKNTLTTIPEKCVHDLFSEQAERTPNAVAVEFRGDTYTYKELDDRSTTLAHYLVKMGASKGQLVGICVERSLEMVVGLLGILKAGCAYVPVDPLYPQERLIFLLKNSKVELLLTLDKFKNRFADLYTVIALDSEWESISSISDGSNNLKGDAKDLMYIIYTSGSTGTPKGVMVTHKNVVNHCQNVIDRFGLTCDDRVLQVTSISFDVAVQEIFPTLLAGATLVLWKEKHLSDGAHFLRWVNDSNISVINLTTAYWYNLVSDLKEQLANVPASLKLVIVGGEKVSYETYLAWKEVVGDKVRWINDYGLTETTISATMFIPEDDWKSDNAVPIGYPLDNVEIYILDANIQPVPIGVYGELCVGGAGVASGYWELPELTQQRFVVNPFSQSVGAKLYKTGDMARFLKDGNIEFLGRVDHQIKIHGYRVELGEIEAVLEKHDALKRAVVVPRPTPHGSLQLVAYIVSDEPSIGYGELKTFLKTRLPEYMVPSHFVLINEVPLTVNGKVDGDSLPPVEGNSLVNREYVAPRSGAEKSAVSLWEKIIGDSRIGITDDFFERGGNSLLATQLISHAKVLYECDIPLKTLFEYPILMEWVEQVEKIQVGAETTRGQVESNQCLVKIQQNGSKTPLIFIHPVGGTITCYFPLARKLGDSQPFYALQAQGMFSNNSSLDTVEKMADSYITEILAVQPQGPYRLGGWSMGGFIAYEIARRLQDAGHKVQQLVLIDCYLSRLVDASHEAILYNFVRQLATGEGKHIADADILEWKSRNLNLSLICTRLKALGVLPRYTDVAEVQRRLDVYATTALAFSKYHPSLLKKLNIENVLLFRASDSSEEEGVWGELLASLSLYRVKADHFSIVHNSAIARIINSESD